MLVITQHLAFISYKMRMELTTDKDPFKKTTDKDPRRRPQTKTPLKRPQTIKMIQRASHRHHSKMADKWWTY